MRSSLSTHRYWNAVRFVVLAALWGGTFPAVTVGLESFPPILYAALRLYLGAALLLLYVMWAFDYWLPREPRDWLAVCAGGVLTLAGYSVLQNVGQQIVPSAIASVLTGLIPILTIGFATVLLPEERFGASEASGVAIGFIGVVVITQPDPSSLLAGDTVGQGILVLAGVSFALGGILTQWANTKMPSAPRTAWAMLLGAGLTHLASIASPNESWRLVQLSPGGLIALAYLGVFVSAVGYLIYFALLPQLGSVELNLVTYAIALFGAVFSSLLFAAPVTVSTLGGFALILLGFGLLKRDELYMAYRTGFETE